MSRPGDYEAVRKDIAAQLKKPDYDDGSAGPVFVRLAWYVAFVGVGSLCQRTGCPLRPDRDKIPC